MLWIYFAAGVQHSHERDLWAVQTHPRRNDQVRLQRTSSFTSSSMILSFVQLNKSRIFFSDVFWLPTWQDTTKFSTSSKSCSQFSTSLTRITKKWWRDTFPETFRLSDQFDFIFSIFILFIYSYLLLLFCTWILFPADEDHGEGERHLQRGEADGCGWALAGLSAAGVLQPGFYSQFTDHCAGSDWKQLSLMLQSVTRSGRQEEANLLNIKRFFQNGILAWNVTFF